MIWAKNGLVHLDLFSTKSKNSEAAKGGSVRRYVYRRCLCGSPSPCNKPMVKCHDNVHHHGGIIVQCHCQKQNPKSSSLSLSHTHTHSSPFSCSIVRAQKGLRGSFSYSWDSQSRRKEMSRCRRLHLWIQNSLKRSCRNAGLLKLTINVFFVCGQQMRKM